MIVTRHGVLEQARATLGMKEDPPFSNRCEISEWYGLIGPWCAMAVDYWWVKAGGRSLRQVLTPSWAYTPAGLAAGRRAGWAIRHRDATPGDFVYFDFRRGGDAVEHIGVLETNNGDAGLVCIEGNTGAGSDADGGAVQRRQRQWSQVVGVLRPPYTKAPAPPPPSPPPLPLPPLNTDEEDLDVMRLLVCNVPGHPDRGKGMVIHGFTRQETVGTDFNYWRYDVGLEGRPPEFVVDAPAWDYYKRTRRPI